MDLIIETDIGHDPDDFFAITYLAAAGVNIRAILISPGDPDQIAIAKLICDQLGLNIPIGTSKENRTKYSSGSVHYDLLDYVVKWCDCDSIEECKILIQTLENEKGIFLGEFVKALLKINNISSYGFT